jgi:hypothetical protein
MIQIRPDQMQMFLDQVRNTFVSRTAAYLRAHHRDWVQEMDNKELQALIRRQISAAEGYGITTEVPVVQFIEVGLAYGEAFHSSGQYPEAERILTQDIDGTLKMQQLQELARNGLQAPGA